jgi:hypothetical protein
LPIKALLLIFALGRMSRARRPVLPHAIDRIDAANSVVAEHIAPARLALSEAKGALSDFGLGLYNRPLQDERAAPMGQCHIFVTDDAHNQDRVGRHRRVRRPASRPNIALST